MLAASGTTPIAELSSPELALHDWISGFARTERAAGQYSTFEALLTHGRLGTGSPLPGELAPCDRGGAFRAVPLAAATRYAHDRGLMYAEGYVRSARTGYAREHAWLEDDAGTIFDLTAPGGSADTAYLGIRISLLDILTLSENDDEDVSATPVIFGDWLRGLAWHESHRACCQTHVSSARV